MRTAIVFNPQGHSEISMVVTTGKQKSTSQVARSAVDKQMSSSQVARSAVDKQMSSSQVARSAVDKQVDDSRTASSAINHCWSESLSGDAQVLIRPISKLDASAHRAFFDGLAPATKRMRFLGSINQLSEALIAQLTDIDGTSQVALVALVKDGAAETIIGISRYSKLAGVNQCESALVVSDDWQHKGLGTTLMQHLIEIARTQGLTAMESTEFAQNTDMRTLMQELGFHSKTDPLDATQVIYTLDLSATDQPIPSRRN
jgi:GNAT superfamily N-acetyltransferase